MTDASMTFYNPAITRRQKLPPDDPVLLILLGMLIGFIVMYECLR